MSGEMAVSFVLKLNDQGSGPATQAMQKILRAMKEVGEVAKSASSTAISAFQKLANSREILGIRSEKAIQNEIRQTEAAYQRLAASGQASARELGRAQDAMRGKVSELRRELDGVKTSAGGIPATMRVAMGAFGAYQAGKMVVAEPVKQTMAYDRSLAHLSNTAFAGQSMDARKTGMRTLDAAIVSAVRTGGGTRESAMGTLDKLVASGAFSDINEATRLLPVLTKAGTASNADPMQMADIAIRAKQTFGLKDTGLALDQAMKAGQLGGFELKDMAKWLPQQMGMARQSGLKGEDGFKTLLAANQAVAITAGTKDEAGNNLVNLLAKINSQDTAHDAKKLGIDLPGTLAAARGKGVNSLDAFVNLTEQIVAKDKGYVSLREKSKNATGDEKKATYESMGDILQGSAIGKIVQDRQALMALVGIMNNRGYMNDVRGQLDNAQGTTNDAFGLIAETPSYKAEMLAAESANNLQTALDRVNPLLGMAADGFSSLSKEFPTLAAAVSGTKLGVEALGAAAFVAAGSLALLGGGKGGVGKTVIDTVKRVLPGSGALGAAGIAALPALAMWGVTEWAGDPNDTMGSSKRDKSNVETIQGWGSSLSKMLGYLGFNKEAEFEAIRKKNQGEVEEPTQPQVVRVEVDVKNGNIVASVNEANARNAQRH